MTSRRHRKLLSTEDLLQNQNLPGGFQRRMLLVVETSKAKLEKALPFISNYRIWSIWNSGRLVTHASLLLGYVSMKGADESDDVIADFISSLETKVL